MKILAIGDFHGKFPSKFEKVIKKEKIDIVISVGDYPPFAYRKLWFKHCFRTGIGLWEVIGKEKYKKIVMRDYTEGGRVLKKLNDLGVKVFTTFGNIDGTQVNDYLDMDRIEKRRGKSSRWKWDEQNFFEGMLNGYKNITRIDYRVVRVGDFVLIGAYGGTNPGHVKSKAYKKYKKILDGLFKKFRNENIIFVSHNAPYKTKLDKLSMKAHVDVRGKHYGSKMIRRVIQAHQPVVAICGHIHEGFGMDKIGKTVCVNSGAAHEGQAAIIEIDNRKLVKVKFIK